MGAVGSWDIVDGTSTGYESCTIRGSNPKRGKRFSILRNCPDQNWSPSSLEDRRCWRGSELGVNLPGLGYHYPPTPSVDVKRSRSTPLFLLCLFSYGKGDL